MPRSVLVLLEDCKRRATNAFVVWLDLKNAFGSVPHCAIWDMMCRLGVPIATVHQYNYAIYTGSTQKVIATTGATMPIVLQRGIKQACPYADHLCLISSTTDYMQSMVTEAETFISWGGLTLNAAKCAALTVINNRGRRFVSIFTPWLEEGRVIPALRLEDTHK